MLSISQLKDKALEQLKGNWTEPVLATLVYVVIVGVLAGMQEIPKIGNLIYLVIALLFFPVYGAGYAIAMLTFFRGDKNNLISKLFDPLKNEYGRYLGTMLLVAIYTFLWTLLFIIPGIIKSLSYAMTVYILKDNPEMNNNEAIELSMKMMDGYKWKLFVLQLSFLGWALLGILTLGIGYLWLFPYIQTTMAAFYEARKDDFTANNIVVE